MAGKVKKRRKYDRDTLLHAIAAVKNKSLSLRQAAAKYGIPHSTLGDRLKLGPSIQKPGPQCKMTAAQQNKLVEHFLFRARIGNGAYRDEIRFIIKEIFDTEERNRGELLEERVFPNNLPSKSRVQRFMNRYPNLAARTPENLGHLRKRVTTEHLQNFSLSMEDYLLNEHKIVASEFFTEENSNRVFSLDEFGFPLEANKKLGIVTQKGFKSVYNAMSKSEEQITVLFCVSADGTFEKPFVIFPGESSQIQFKSDDESKYEVGLTKSGWISTESFFGWFTNHFVMKLKVRDIKFPIVVFMNSHTTHINMALVEFCKNNDVILFCLPAHASHIIQPLDVCVFGPLKSFWNEAIENYQIEHGINMTRTNFFPLFDEVFEKAKTNNIKSGFRNCGLVPYNFDAIDFTHLISEKETTRSYFCKDEVSPDQTLGMIRSFQRATECMSAASVKLFEQRYEEGYDVIEETNINELWRVYKALRDLTKDTCWITDSR